MSVWEMFQFWMVKGFGEAAAGIIVCVVLLIGLLIFVCIRSIKATLLMRRDRHLPPMAGQTWVSEDGDEYTVQFVNNDMLGMCVRGSCSFAWSRNDFEIARERKKLHLKQESEQ